jgi:O-antigen/teichoic acid export membrane protein
LYSRAFTLLMAPLTQIRGPLTTLSLPVLSSLKSDPARYLSYFQKLLDISISLALPISVYCFLEGEFLIKVLLGQKWMAAVPVFKILSIAGIFVATSGAPGLVMLSQGFSKRYFYLNILTSVITSVAIIIGVFFGITGVAVAYTIASFLKIIPLILYGFKETPIKLQLIFESVRGPVFAAVVAAISTYIFILFYLHDSITKHIFIGIIFFMIYTTFTLIRPRTLDTLRAILASIVSKQK